MNQRSRVRVSLVIWLWRVYILCNLGEIRIYLRISVFDGLLELSR